MSAVLPHAGGGKVRLIAVSTTRRAAALPDLPTINESGVPGYNTGLWTGLMVRPICRRRSWRGCMARWPRRWRPPT